ncbi:DUF4829 domain-containing protein [Clostridium thermobutyricum]|uniref:DUF4829 domain-containing protein n=1 Tax=Clostridium thermobutyricum TaxID=29372 RepID=N9WAE5_9CLOT|nr:DUF4829 domain-containing protein [Clostridium thermobutyricum]ENY99995.1 hypothetical protein HMPREF1092_03132 [Clostridium thermobutyricum]
MKSKKIIVIGSIFICIIVISFIFLNNKPNTNNFDKETVLKNFYTSYENKDIKLYNESVINELKTKNSEEEKLRQDVYDDIIEFKLIKIKELPNSSTEFNGKTFDKSNIAKFEVFYNVDFNKNLTSSNEGNISTIKILTRENENSPWLVSGQEGQGL